jgi:multisite-specific tRNA:(cytosine-C5)-methyltransferase
VGEILRASGGSVELLDVSSELPELKRRPGMMSWKVSGHSLSHLF